jgi:hypothetical protein
MRIYRIIKGLIMGLTLILALIVPIRAYATVHPSLSNPTIPEPPFEVAYVIHTNVGPSRVWAAIAFSTEPVSIDYHYEGASEDDGWAQLFTFTAGTQVAIVSGQSALGGEPSVELMWSESTVVYYSSSDGNEIVKDIGLAPVLSSDLIGLDYIRVHIEGSLQPWIRADFRTPILIRVVEESTIGHGGGSGEFFMRMDVAPFIENGRTFLPVRYVAESFGIFTSWDGASQSITLQRGHTTVQLTVGDYTLSVRNGSYYSTKDLDVAPFVRNGRTVMPIRHVAQAFGLVVSWNEDHVRYHGDGTVYTGLISISEGVKTLNLVVDKPEQIVVDGHFLRFIETEHFRIAIPRYPVVTSYSFGHVNVLVRSWHGPDRRIVISHRFVEDMDLSDSLPGSMAVRDIIFNRLPQGMAVSSIEDITFNGLSATKYLFVAADEFFETRAIIGIAFRYNGWLISFDIRTIVENLWQAEGHFPQDSAIESASVLFEELLPTLTLLS